MDMKKRMWKFIWMIVGVVILGTFLWSGIQYRRGWFTEMIPDNGYAEYNGERKLGEVLGEELPTGENRWREGDWTFDEGFFMSDPKGIVIQDTLDVTITHGTLKYVVYDMGRVDTWQEARKIAIDGPENLERVYEQDLIESGIYQIELSDFDPESVYWVALMTTTDGDNEYSYNWHMTSSAPRWYRIHDKWLAWLPFVDEKWTTSPNW